MTSGKEKWWSRTREVYTVQRRSKIIMKEKKTSPSTHNSHNTYINFCWNKLVSSRCDQQWEPELSFAEWVMTVKKKNNNNNNNKEAEMVRPSSYKKVVLFARINDVYASNWTKFKKKILLVCGAVVCQCVMQTKN